jgi:hypothetical protein
MKIIKIFNKKGGALGRQYFVKEDDIIYLILQKNFIPICVELE